MRGRGRLALLAIACLVVGAGLMLAFELPAARIAGVLLLTAWIVIGAFALATPTYLAQEDGPEDEAAGTPTSPGAAAARRGGGSDPPRLGG